MLTFALVLAHSPRVGSGLYEETLAATRAANQPMTDCEPRRKSDETWHDDKRYCSAEIVCGEDEDGHEHRDDGTEAPLGQALPPYPAQSQLNAICVFHPVLSWHEHEQAITAEQRLLALDTMSGKKNPLYIRVAYAVFKVIATFGHRLTYGLKRSN
jgi:hypothetical protein